MSRGAERLCISQPAVSKQIKELEKALGVTLLDRLPQGTRLTAAGEVLSGFARRLFAVEADAERAIAELKGLKQGRLTVGASLTIGDYLLPKILGEYRKKHPGIELRLEIANTHVIQRRLRDNALDIALTEGFVEDPELEAEVFSEDTLTAVVPARSCSSAGKQSHSGAVLCRAVSDARAGIGNARSDRAGTGRKGDLRSGSHVSRQHGGDQARGGIRSGSGDHFSDCAGHGE